MKAVLMSIQPYWLFLIIAKKMDWNIGKEKTIEVRKNYPKDENWNKVAKIYCSKDKKSFSKIPKEYQPLMEQFLGKVIGEFVCNEIQEVHQCNSGWVQEYACISQDEFFDYLGIPRGTHFGYDKKAYVWHISNLVIYDKPKELSEFYRKCDKIGCDDCEHFDYEIIDDDEFEFECEYFCETDGYITITRPPQSWCYVENEVAE